MEMSDRRGSSCLQDLSVGIEGAFKSYDSQPVLKGLNMNVRSSSIYALLGPSGCGKTTLLNAIMGITSLDSGIIKVNCDHKSELGFMPQALALYVLLNINETLYYYGRIQGLNKKKIQSRSKEILDLLELPEDKQKVETLSGGQQRRVSIAVALIHDPQIIILDEPTVGLDPILKQSIWKYFLKLTNEENRTVIITTHYIEEAKQAHTVGLMRGGIIMLEDIPSQIVANFNCQTIEEAFLKLSQIQEISSGQAENDLAIDNQKANCSYPEKLQRKQWQLTAHCLQAELIKNFFFLIRSKGMIFYFYSLPVIIAIIFNMTFGSIPEFFNIGLINNELENGFETCTSEMSIGCNLSQPISCRYLNVLQEGHISFVHFDDFESAKGAALRNEVWGIMMFPSNYSSSILERIELNLNTGDGSVDSGQTYVWLDMSNYAFGYILQFEVFEAFKTFMANFLRDCGWPESTLAIPIQFRDPVFGFKKPNITHSASAAMLLLIMFHLPMMFTIGGVMQEKITGVLGRSVAAGVSMLEVYLSHLILQLIVFLIQMVLVIFVLFYIYSTPLKGSLTWMIILLIFQGICGQALGFFCAVFFFRPSFAAITGVGVLIALIFLSGLIWPLEGFYLLPQWCGWLTPLSGSAEALRGITSRGWSITHPIVIKGYVSLTIWIGIFLTMSYFTLKLRKSSLL